MSPLRITARPMRTTSRAMCSSSREQYTQSRLQRLTLPVSEAGQAKEYFTDDRAVTDESDITHEWFVDQTQYVTIRPADITVYTGGNSYDGVTDENGQIVSGGGLPEAGYLLTVPEEINDMLEGPGQAVDLAGHLTLPMAPAKPPGPGIFSFTATALPAPPPRWTESPVISTGWNR